MTRSILRLTALFVASVCGATSLHAQSPIDQLRPVAQSNRIAANADLGPQTQLSGHIPGWVSNGTSMAQSVDLSANMNITIVVERDPAVQAAFEQLLQDQQTPGNPLYHQWLTPQQVGTLFGPTASDLAAVTNWLTSQGLTIDSIEPNQIMINVHGTTSAIASAFRTSFAYYPLNGTPRISTTSEPYVPTALSPVINSIFGLTDFPLNPLSHISGPQQPVSLQGSSSNPHPQLTTTSGNHYVTPNDFATIFDINSVYSGGNTGATIGSKPQHVAIIGRSYVATSDITEYITNVASSFNINNLVAITPPGATAPGSVCTFATQSTCSTSGDQGEQTLDVDRVIGTAPGAYVDLVVSTSINSDISYNVNTLLDPVMTISYGLCELNSNTASYNLVNGYFSQGQAEGISTFVSSGDSGANGCAGDGTAVSAPYYAASMNYLCASSYVTCVGGTEFNDTASPSTYWLSANGTGYESAISYIPEGAWNEPSGSCATSGTYCPLASGGGASIFNTTKPTWQTGTGVPNDGVRDTPDIAYPAAGHDGYYACMDFALSKSTENCTTSGGGYFFDFYGTSAAAPSMAGVAALLNTKLGTAQGNLNPLLYKLAATSSNNVFHDTTVASSGVSGCSITVPSMCNNSTPGSSSDSTAITGGLQGFLLTTGYDQATGLGSIDVANLLSATAAATVSTTLALTTVTPNPAITGNTVTLTATITRSLTTPGNATGTVSFYYTPSGGTATLIGSAVTVSNNAATTTTSFTTAGTYTITAIYSGDTNYGTSTATGVSLVVNAGPSFTVVPATTTYSLISGATTGNTDTITLTSTNSFVGSVAMSCAVTTTSGTAAGTCSASTPVALTSGGTGTSTLTITTTPGTSGVLSVTVTGTSGTTVVTSSAITVNLTASSFTLTASPNTVSIAGNASSGTTTTVTIASGAGFAGTVTVSCASANTAVVNCAGSSAVVTANGTANATVTITPVLHMSGSAIVLTISGSGTTTGATVPATATTTARATVTTVPATTTLVVSPTTVVTGSPTTLTATVSGTNGTPTGSVFFYSGATELNVSGATLSTTAGVTTATYVYTPTTASATPQAITADYVGDSGYSSTVSAATNLSVTGFTAAISSTNTSITVTSGATTGNTAQFTFTPVGAFTGTVTITCSVSTGSAVYPPTCSVSPTSVALSPGAPQITTLTIATTTPHAITGGPQHSSLYRVGGAVFALLVCMVPFRRRRFIRPLMSVLLLTGALTAISGCGGSSTPVLHGSAGSYTVTVTGTSGTATTNATIPLTVN